MIVQSPEEKQLKIKLENLEFSKASPDNTNDPTKGLLAANMPLLLNTAWSLSAMDIESSVSSASANCIHTLSFPSHVFIHFPFLFGFAAVLFTLLFFLSHCRQAAQLNTSRETSECHGKRASIAPGPCSCSARCASCLMFHLRAKLPHVSFARQFT
jgi:hypothetical protein